VLSLVNQSIKAFTASWVRKLTYTAVFLAKEVEGKKPRTMEDAKRQPDLAKSVQRYQLAG